MTKERVTVSHKVVAGPSPFQCLSSADDFHGTIALSFVIPSEAEGSAVLRIFPGNVFSTDVPHPTVHYGTAAIKRP
jgi:hypothetical protein